MLRRAPAAPDQLLERARLAQADHAAAISTANTRLCMTHAAIYAEAHDRQATIDEQVKLLSAERAGLDSVKAAAHGKPR